jgi:3'(2'), 5'-bisphosphate nucleotidase
VEKEKIRELTMLALETAFEAGQKILEIYSDKFTVDIKSDGSPLTAADKASHDTIVSRLAHTNLPVLSEEGKDILFDERSQWSYYWLVDPLDGTKEFIKRNGEFTVNIALMEFGVPVSGVIFQPVTGMAFAGIAGDGLYKFSVNEKPSINSKSRINIDFPNAENQTRVIASRSHMSDKTEGFINELRLKSNNVELVNAGSSLKFCLLAEGKADIYPRFAPTMEWDTAAGHALLKAVGKNIYLFPSGEEMTYNKPHLINEWFIAK